MFGSHGLRTIYCCVKYTDVQILNLTLAIQFGNSKQMFEKVGSSINSCNLMAQEMIVPI